MKPTTYFILFFSMTILNACGLSGTNPQSAINVENQKTKINEQLGEVVAKNILTQAQADTIKRMLVAHCDLYLNSKELSCEQITGMANRTVASLDNMPVTQDVFVIITETYHNIASSNQVRDLSKVGAYCNPVGDLWQWFANKQPEKDKFDNMRLRINQIKDSSLYSQKMGKELLDSIVNQLTAEIEQVEQDSMMDNDKVKELIISGMAKLDGRKLDNYLLLDVVNVYGDLARARQLEIKTEIDDFYQKNYKEPVPLTYSQLRKEVEQRIDWMHKQNLIDLLTYQLLKNMMLNDIDALAKGDMSKKMVEKRLKYSLSKLIGKGLETEDREYVAQTYFDLASRYEIDLSKDLNNWLYGF